MVQLTISQCCSAASAEQQQFTALFPIINKQETIHPSSSTVSDAKSAIPVMYMTQKSQQKLILKQIYHYLQ